jgi:hypothetical protein
MLIAQSLYSHRGITELCDDRALQRLILAQMPTCDNMSIIVRQREDESQGVLFLGAMGSGEDQSMRTALGTHDGKGK